jgi:SAM-dependent methyltransferase/MFS family permease
MCAAVAQTDPSANPVSNRAGGPERVWIYYLLFFLSGFPALLYQIVWQRTLFTLFGVNVESVTMVVTVFMLGLGLGSLAGGELSSRRGVRLLAAFGAVELCIGAFGACSLWLFHRVASFTAGASLLTTGLVAFALLLIPTLLMGSTLPLLSEHFVRRTGNVGESVGLLYGINTLGSGIACLLAAYCLMRWLGESGSVHLAVGFNLFVGSTALILQLRRTPAAFQHIQVAPTAERHQTIPLWAGMALACTTGFIALAYEILWYRLFSFASAGTAQCFAQVLAFYLFGIAYGSSAVRSGCRDKLGNEIRRTMAVGAEVAVLGSMAAFLIAPWLAFWVSHNPSIPIPFLFIFLFIPAALLGAVFPLLAHAAIDPASQVGRGVSLLYLSNIAGSTLGSFLIGFVVLDHWSTRATSVFLLGLGLAISLVFAAFSGWKIRRTIFAAEVAACAVLLVSSRPLFSGMYERLLFETGYNASIKFSELAENRSGVIAVFRGQTEYGYPAETVFGGGAYDGRFNVTLLHDSNGLFRAYAVGGMGLVPKRVLMIGLASGSWAQVIANEPGVEDFTAVEINPGYLPLIQHHAEVASLLTNPKVHIVIDDGRRWLVAHPELRFDYIVMNTTFNWRANNTNLLSVEFLRLAHDHLTPGGVLYYNTTWSREVQATGIAMFPYAVRVSSFLALSEAPLNLDKGRWRAMLTAWHIDGRPVFDLGDPAQRATMEDVLRLADQLDVPGGNLESRTSLANRLKGIRLITDDNMGTEWMERDEDERAGARHN